MPDMPQFTRRSILAGLGLAGVERLLRVPPRTPPGREKKTPTPTATIPPTAIVAPTPPATPVPPAPAPVATVTGGAGVLRVALADPGDAAAIVVAAHPAGGGDPIILEREL
jgi:hypothetical protein